MARPGSTYRGARFNAGFTQPLTIAAKGKTQRLEPMAPAKERPVQPKGWDWRIGGRRERDTARSPSFKEIVAEMGLSIGEALRAIAGGK